MKIGINAIFYGELAGGYKHLCHLLDNWKKEKENHHFIVFLQKKNAPEFNYYSSHNIHLKVIPLVHLSPVFGIIWSTLFLPLITRFGNFSRLFLPFNSFIPRPKWFGCITISVIRDLAEYEIEKKYDIFRMIYRKKLMMPRTINNSDRLIFISKSTYEDTFKHLNYRKKNFRIIHHGKSNIFTPVNYDTVFHSKFGLAKKKYFLTVGRLDPIGKNLIRLLQAFEIFIRKNQDTDFRIVLVGSKWRNTQELHKFIGFLNAKENVILTGYLPQIDLIQLYSHAMAFIFPTVYEGFGHPVIEAMSCGCPVICSNVSSLPEIAGNAALLFDPYNYNDIVHKMIKVGNKDIQRDLINLGFKNVRKFSWEKCSKGTIKYITR
jgi:glycosyltransferase involved in cell wall biosynthesis